MGGQESSLSLDHNRAHLHHAVEQEVVELRFLLLQVVQDIQTEVSFTPTHLHDLEGARPQGPPHLDQLSAHEGPKDGVHRGAGVIVPLATPPSRARGIVAVPRVVEAVLHKAGKGERTLCLDLLRNNLPQSL